MIINGLSAIKTISIMTLLFSLINLTGCGQPEETLVKEGIELELAQKYKRELIEPTVEIKAFENSGTKIEPKYKSRFVATVKLREPRYKKIETITAPGLRDFTLVQQIFAAGDKMQAFGTSTSELKSEKLVTNVNVSSFGAEDLGYLLESFDNPIIEGSNEYKVVMDEIKRIGDLRAKAVLDFRKKLIGNWGGNTFCDNKEYGFTLAFVGIYTTGDNSHTILEARYTDAKTPNSEPESFDLSGTLELDGSFKLDPTKWISRVNNGYWAGFHGKYDKDTETISGKVTKTRNCSTFKLSRS